MKKSNWIILAVLAVACGFFLWLWYYLDFNLVDDPLDLLVAIAWWAVVAALIFGIRFVEKRREERIRTAFVAPNALFNSEAGFVMLGGGESPVMALQQVLKELKYHFDRADLPEGERASFVYIVRTKKFAEGGDAWEGEVVVIDRSDSEPLPFANRDELLNIVESVPLPSDTPSTSSMGSGSAVTVPVGA